MLFSYKIALIFILTALSDKGYNLGLWFFKFQKIN